MPDKRELKLEILKEIIQIMKDEDISEVSIQQNDLKIKVKRLPDQLSLATQGAAMMAPQQEEAHSEAKEILKVYPSFSIRKLLVRMPQKNNLVLNKWTQALRKAGLPD